MLAAVASPALHKLLADGEAEKAGLEGHLGTSTTVVPSDTILLHPALLQLFEEKAGRLRKMLEAETVHSEAAEILSTFTESVTIYPEGRALSRGGVVTKVTNLIIWATNDSATREGGDRISTDLVAGTGFEPVTFRL